MLNWFQHPMVVVSLLLPSLRRFVFSTFCLDAKGPAYCGILFRQKIKAGPIAPRGLPGQRTVYRLDDIPAAAELAGDGAAHLRHLQRNPRVRGLGSDVQEQRAGRRERLADGQQIHDRCRRIQQRVEQRQRLRGPAPALPVRLLVRSGFGLAESGAFEALVRVVDCRIQTPGYTVHGELLTLSLDAKARGVYVDTKA